MDKKILIAIMFVCFSTFVLSTTSYNFLTKGWADTLYCQIGGSCYFSSLNVTTINNQQVNGSLNVTGLVIAYGIQINGTAIYDIFYPRFLNPNGYLNSSNISNFATIQNLNNNISNLSLQINGSYVDNIELQNNLSLYFNKTVIASNLSNYWKANDLTDAKNYSTTGNVTIRNLEIKTGNQVIKPNSVDTTVFLIQGDIAGSFYNGSAMRTYMDINGVYSRTLSLGEANGYTMLDLYHIEQSRYNGSAQRSSSEDNGIVLSSIFGRQINTSNSFFDTQYGIQNYVSKGDYWQGSSFAALQSVGISNYVIENSIFWDDISELTVIGFDNYIELGGSTQGAGSVDTESYTGINVNVVARDYGGSSLAAGIKVQEISGGASNYGILAKSIDPSADWSIQSYNTKFLQGSNDDSGFWNDATYWRFNPSLIGTIQGYLMNKWLVDNLTVKNAIYSNNITYIAGNFELKNRNGAAMICNQSSFCNFTGAVNIDGNLTYKKPYLFASSNHTHTLAAINTAYPVFFNQTEDNYMIDIQNKQNITFAVAGDYLIELSAIFTTSTPNNHPEIWVQKTNSTGQLANVARSNTRTHLSNANAEQVVSVPFIIDVNSNDKIRIVWAGDSTNLQMIYTGATAYSPETPSIIMTVSKVGEVTP